MGRVLDFVLPRMEAARADELDIGNCRKAKSVNVWSVVQGATF